MVVVVTAVVVVAAAAAVVGLQPASAPPPPPPSPPNRCARRAKRRSSAAGPRLRAPTPRPRGDQLSLGQTAPRNSSQLVARRMGGWTDDETEFTNELAMHWVTQSLPYNLNYNKISYPASRLLPVIQQARELARVSDLENKIDSLECHRMDLQQMLQNSEEQMPWYLDMEPETPKYDRIPVLVSSPSNGAHEYEFAALLGFEEDSHSESSYSEDISDSENSSHLAIGPGVQDVPADTMKPEPYHDLTSDDTIGTEVTSPDYTQPWIEHEVRNVSPPIQTERGFLSNIHQIWTPVNDPTMFPPSGAEYGQSTIYCQTSQIAAGDWVNQAALNIQQGQATFYCQPSQIGAGEWRNDASFISQGQSTTYYQPTQFIGGEWQNQATFNIQGQSTIFCQATEMGAGECGNQPAFNLQQGQPIIYCQPSGIGVGEWINQASFNIERDQSAIYFQPPQIGAVGGTHTIYNVQQSQSTIYYPPSHVGISEWPNQAAFNIQQSHAVIPCQPPAMGSAISTNSWRYTETHVEEQNQQVVILQGQKTVTSYTHTTYGQHPEPPRQHTIVPWPQPMRQNGLQQIPLIQDRNPNVQREEYTRGIWSRRPFMQSSERQDARPASRVNEANGGETSYYPPVRHAPAPRPREKPLLRQNAKWRETDNSSVRYIAPPLREQNSIPDHSSLRYVAPHRREKQDTEPPNARWIEPPDTAPKQYLAPHWRQRQGKKFGANWGWKDAPLGRGSDTTMQEKQDDRNAKWGHSDDVGRSLSDTPMLGKGASPKAIWTRKDNVQGAWRQGSPFMREEVIAPKEIKQAWCRADISSRSNSADPWREQRGNSNGNCDRKDDWRRRDVTEQEQENPETRTRANWGKDDASLSSTAVPTKEVPRLDSNASSVSAGREDKENKAEFIPRIILSRRMKYLERPDPATLQAEGCLERPSSSSDEIKATQAPAERKSTGFFTNKYKAGGSRPTANSFNDHDGARNPHRERVTPTSAINHGNVKFARNIGPSDAATCAETAQFTKDTTCAPWIAAGDGASSARAISPAGRPRAQDPANCLTTGTIPELSGKSISYAHPASNIAGTAKSIDICSRVGTTDHDIAPDADRLNLLYCRASADDNHSDPRNAGAHDVTAPDNGETAKGAAKDKGDTNRINQRDGGYAKDDIVKQIATKESAHIDGGAAEVAAKDFNCKDDGAVEATAGSTGPDKVVGNDIVRLANCNGITSNDPAAADTAADDGAIASVAGAASTTSGDVSDEEDLAGTEVLSGPSVAECRFSMNAEHKNKSEDTSWRCRESHHNSKIFLMRKLKRWGVPKRETSHNHRKNLRGRNNGAEPGRSRQSTTEEEANNENSRKIARNSTSEMQRDCKNICRKAPNNQNSRKQWNGARNVHFCGNKNVSRMPHNFTNSWKRPNHVKRTKWTQRDGYLQEEKNSTAGISCSYWNREKSKKMIAQSGSQHTHVRRTRTTHGKLPEEGSQGSVDRQENTATKSWLNSAKKIQMSSKHFQEERYFVPGCPQTEDTQTWRKASVSERKAPISWIRTSDGHLQQQSSSENQEVS